MAWLNLTNISFIIPPSSLLVQFHYCNSSKVWANWEHSKQVFTRIFQNKLLTRPQAPLITKWRRQDCISFSLMLICLALEEKKVYRINLHCHGYANRNKKVSTTDGWSTKWIFDRKVNYRAISRLVGGPQFLTFLLSTT